MSGRRGACRAAPSIRFWCGSPRDRVIRLVGINYKDAPENARGFLARSAIRLRPIGVDRAGRASIEWGVYGVPETFLIGRDGRDHLQA